MAKSSKVKLPEWAAEDGKNAVRVDPDKFYPAILSDLGVDEKDVDQYWLEVAYQFMKMDVQKAMGHFNFNINVTNRPKWALANHKPGRGIVAATQGREARQHYVRIRGTLPV